MSPKIFRVLLPHTVEADSPQCAGRVWVVPRTLNFSGRVTKTLPLYSQVPIKRVGHNKRAGWIFLKKLINVQGYSVPNKRVGWNFSENFTNV